MAFQIREAVGEDAEGIQVLNDLALGYRYPLEETRERLETLLKSGKDRIFVAETGGRVVGYIHAVDYDALYAPPLKNIMGLAVSGEHRREGIGKALLAAVEKWAMETEAEGIRLVSGETRTEAHGFYRRCGYILSKNQKNFKKMF